MVLWTLIWKLRLIHNKFDFFKNSDQSVFIIENSSFAFISISKEIKAKNVTISLWNKITCKYKYKYVETLRTLFFFVLLYKQMSKIEKNVCKPILNDIGSWQSKFKVAFPIRRSAHWIISVDVQSLHVQHSSRHFESLAIFLGLGVKICRNFDTEIIFTCPKLASATKGIDPSQNCGTLLRYLKCHRYCIKYYKWMYSLQSCAVSIYCCNSESVFCLQKQCYNR